MRQPAQGELTRMQAKQYDCTRLNWQACAKVKGKKMATNRKLIEQKHFDIVVYFVVNSSICTLKNNIFKQYCFQTMSNGSTISGIGKDYVVTHKHKMTTKLSAYIWVIIISMR